MELKTWLEVAAASRWMVQLTMKDGDEITGIAENYLEDIHRLHVRTAAGNVFLSFEDIDKATKTQESSSPGEWLHIEGSIQLNAADNPDAFLNEFILWLESNGRAFAGVTKPEEEE
ncbi:hypothetical protein [Paenibacillus gansuensis]|uniref:Uncharacterized protein n=1 Tax=Paenibacillus gansuensis TaxID=306542 RepID=A0ABW5PF80_9BACL